MELNKEQKKVKQFKQLIYWTLEINYQVFVYHSILADEDKTSFTKCEVKAYFTGKNDISLFNWYKLSDLYEIFQFVPIHLRR